MMQGSRKPPGFSRGVVDLNSVMRRGCRGRPGRHMIRRSIRLRRRAGQNLVKRGSNGLSEEHCEGLQRFRGARPDARREKAAPMIVRAARWSAFIRKAEKRLFGNRRSLGGGHDRKPALPTIWLRDKYPVWRRPKRAPTDRHQMDGD